MDTVASFICHSGYFLNTRNSSICQNQGNWNVQMPTCHQSIMIHIGVVLLRFIYTQQLSTVFANYYLMFVVNCPALILQNCDVSYSTARVNGGYPVGTIVSCNSEYSGSGLDSNGSGTGSDLDENGSGLLLGSEAGSSYESSGFDSGSGSGPRDASSGSEYESNRMWSGQHSNKILISEFESNTSGSGLEAESESSGTEYHTSGSGLGTELESSGSGLGTKFKSSGATIDSK